MSGHAQNTLGLIVRQAPYAQREPRAQLDMALAAATLELPLEVYFLGAGIWQLAAGRETDAAMLPRGLNGWAAVADMTVVRYFAEPGQYGRLAELGADTVVPVETLDCSSMSRRWRDCLQLVAL